MGTMTLSPETINDIKEINMPDNDHNLTRQEIPQIEESPLEKKINWIAGQSIGSTFAEELLEHFLDAPELITSGRIEEWVEQNNQEQPVDVDLLRDVLHIIQIIHDGNGEYDKKVELTEEEPFIVKVAYSTYTFQTILAKTKEEAVKKIVEPTKLNQDAIEDLIANLERDEYFDEGYETFPELEDAHKEKT